MKTILVPTDFSKNSLKALRFAIELAVKNTYKIVVVHQTSILEMAPESTFTGFYVPSPIDQIGFLKTELDKFLNRAMNTSASKINKTELSKLRGKMKDKGFTIVPLQMFLSESGFAKL